VPLASVLVAIDAAFEKDPSTSSLAGCRRRVEELAAGGAGRTASGTDRGGGGSLPELGERLDALHERLLELPGRVAALPLAELDAVRDLVAVASRPNWDYLRARLRRIDALVSQAAVEASGTGGGPRRNDPLRAPSREGRRARSKPRPASAPAGGEALRLPRVSTD
jgi:hypothetical protein